MNALKPFRESLLVFCICLMAGPALAQSQAYEPQVGQEGKDVVWVPTPQSLVEKMLDMAEVTDKDFVIDLGSGDGRTVIAAAKRGARALGIEYNPDMIELSRRNAASEKASERAAFEQADLFESDLSKATVITMFLLPDINLKLRPKILDLKPGTRIVSNSFTMGDWQADDTITIEEDCSAWCTAHLWIVPAKAEGIWHLGNEDLFLNQEFQMVSGTLNSGSNKTPITDGRLNGSQITFTAGAGRYNGFVNGSTIEGTVLLGGKTNKWVATRTRQ